MVRRARALGVTALVLQVSCYDAREQPQPAADTCEGCHGTAGAPGSLAPPPGLWLSGGMSSTDERGVGAHKVHLTAGKLAAPTPCETCHRVPRSVDSDGHMDHPLPAQVIFSGLATAAGTKATWNGTTCFVYCHTSQLPGGVVTRPKWTKVDGTQAVCGTCHGLPPQGTHPKATLTTCAICHDQTVDVKGAIKNVALHINGKVEVKGGADGCSACHGGGENAAPPTDTSGNSAETARGVGAHQAHVRSTTRHVAYDCSVCHIKPDSIDAPGHIDTPLPAEVTFGALARTNGKQPVWDATALTCAATYCHAGMDGGGNPTPAWNKGEAVVCGSCHALPPAKLHGGGVHPASTLTECANCHPATIDKTGTIINPAKHINGTVEFN